VIASSGGGAATLGHTDPVALLRCLQSELQRVGGFVRHALYVSLDNGGGMDSASLDGDAASLYQVDCSDDDPPDGNQYKPDWCRVAHRGTLREVNRECAALQRKIVAESIRSGRVRGLVMISCHVSLFGETLEAAARARIPVTGSGGTSLSRASATYQIRLAGNAGGSVATTTYTRAVSYTHALAVSHNLPYRPWERRSNSTSAIRPSWTSILNACLPAFWGVCLLKFFLAGAALLRGPRATVELLSIDAVVVVLEKWALPAACAVVMATTMAGSAPSTESAASAPVPTRNVPGLIMASTVASAACTSSVASGLVAGYLVAVMSDRTLYFCIFRSVPATMTNLLTGGGVGGLVALTVLPVAPILRACTDGARRIILASVSAERATYRALAGATWGVLSCYGSKVGWYHAAHLPLILVEMEAGSPSFLGAIDELSLVLVCAGICAGNLASSFFARGARAPTTLSDSDRALCLRGLRTNVWFGDFVECCYPYMESSRIVNVGGYIGSALSSAWLVGNATDVERVPKSLAYLPLPLSIAVAGPNWGTYSVSCMIAFVIPFVATLLHRLTHSRQGRQKAS
jgi:hypothetical protein